MSIQQAGYPPPASSAATTLSARSSPKASVRSSPPCCENGRPVMTNPLNGQTICSCQYNPATVAALYSTYPRVAAGLPEALYSSAIAAQAQGLLPLAAGDPSALYAGIPPGYDFKGLPGTPGIYPFDPSLSAAYPYGNGFLDPNARRKNATRESTATLKAWLNEHKKNPYPTKGEKIMLAIITKMTLTQVSTWFANARRRLKKDHKMTWEPRNRMDDDDDHDLASDDDHDKDDVMEEALEENISVDSDDEDSRNLLRHVSRDMTSSMTSSALSTLPTDTVTKCGDDDDEEDDAELDVTAATSTATTTATERRLSDTKTDESHHAEKDTPKPKIWSMAEIATSSKNSSPLKIDTSSPALSSPHTASSRDTTTAAAATATLSPLPHNFAAPQTLHHNKFPSAHVPMLHPAWRTAAAAAHPYFQAHMLQSRLAAFASHPANRLPTNPFPNIAMTSAALRPPSDARSVASAFVPISNLSKTQS